MKYVCLLKALAYYTLSREYKKVVRNIWVFFCFACLFVCLFVLWVSLFVCLFVCLLVLKINVKTNNSSHGPGLKSNFKETKYQKTTEYKITSGKKMTFPAKWPQIWTWYFRTPIPPLVMTSSAMELQLGVFWLCQTTHAEMNANKMPPRSSRTVRRFTHACLSSSSDRYAPDESQFFDRGENPNTPNRIPMLGQRWSRFCDLWFISVKMTKMHNGLACTWRLDKSIQVVPITPYFLVGSESMFGKVHKGFGMF